jgi:carbon starvation protein
MLPFLFITVACGAISGFHCLVSSGCSSRQLRNELDAKPIGYGSMLTEGFLATLVIVACIAGIGLGASGTDLTGHALWSEYYARWGGDAGLGDKLAPFILGSANMIEHLGISHAIATTIMGVFVASFAATTLDSATRLQRYIIAELAGASERDANRILCAACAYPMPAISEFPSCPECGENRTVSATRNHGPIRTLIMNRFGATTIATVSALILALSDIPSRGLANAGLGGLTLWPIFGATNQLLAALALLVVSVWLFRSGRNAVVVLIPFVVMLVITASALALLVRQFTIADQPMLAVLSAIMIGLLGWASIEAVIQVLRNRSNSSDISWVPDNAGHEETTQSG